MYSIFYDPFLLIFNKRFINKNNGKGERGLSVFYITRKHFRDSDRIFYERLVRWSPYVVIFFCLVQQHPVYRVVEEFFHFSSVYIYLRNNKRASKRAS